MKTQLWTTSLVSFRLCYLNGSLGLSVLYPSGQKTHPYRDINMLPSIVRGTTPLYFASYEA